MTRGVATEQTVHSLLHSISVQECEETSEHGRTKESDQHEGINEQVQHDAEEDQPAYTNVQMPFRAEPPLVPALNPTGLYQRYFTLPDDWADKRTVVYIGGVENCFYLYCNGQEVGFSKDCRLPSEFDLTPFLPLQ